MEGVGDDELVKVAVDAQSSPPPFMDTFEGKRVNKFVISEPLCTNPRDRNYDEDMVEELTLLKNKNLNFGVVGSSNVQEVMRARQGQWKHLYHLVGGLGNRSSQRENVSKDKDPIASGGEEDVGKKHRSSRQSDRDPVEINERLISDKNLLSSNGIRTKLLPPSGFTRLFVKNSLKGKGIVHRYREAGDGISGAMVVSDASLSLGAKADGPSPNLFQDGINLMEWLKPGCRKVDKSEILHIFKQIVELVDRAHSQRVALQDLRPSCFRLLPSSQVKYIGSLVPLELLEIITDVNVPYLEHHLSRKRFLEEGLQPYQISSSKHNKISANMKFTRQHYPFQEVDINNVGTQNCGYDTRDRYLNSEDTAQYRSRGPIVSDNAQKKLNSVKVQLEEKWYTGPEELNEKGSIFSSNIYCLGVLLFELFHCFESWEVRAAAMLDLRHRILPPKFLSEHPKEAGFCLWLLHPEPSSRPTARKILQSELMCESRELLGKDQLSLSVEEDQAESELLLYFLKSLEDQKQRQASKLVEEIGCLKEDIEEIEKKNLIRTPGVPSLKHKDSNTRELGLTPNMSEARLMKNINQFKNSYFSMRPQRQISDSDATGHSDKDVLKNRLSPIQNENEGLVLKKKNTDSLGVFFDGLCKYSRYSKFEVRGTLRNGDLHNNSANVICSLSFDRDEDYFAAAGASKKIKIFDFHALLNDYVDIHYPVIEMSSKSKLSCVCWNSYIKNYLASTDNDGVVQLWDASTGQGFSQYTEHEKRAWSVDFSQVDPTKLASGSDDCSVKLWTINERKCISTIQNAANVCCVQFSSHSTHLLAFGCADYKTYCYDLRNTRTPWCTLAGHGKAVSYVKFLDSETLISASTDSTLKLWNLNKTSSSGLSTSACSLTFRGHTNEKNFVGLSVSKGYIACGSETNEVYAYYRSLPMPITSHKFGSIDPISGQETTNNNGQFVSSVCWRGKSDTVVAANSSGNIKLLQVV